MCFTELFPQPALHLWYMKLCQLSFIKIIFFAMYHLRTIYFIYNDFHNHVPYNTFTVAALFTNIL